MGLGAGEGQRRLARIDKHFILALGNRTEWDSLNVRVLYIFELVPFQNARHTAEAATRSLPSKCQNISSRTSKLRSFVDSMMVDSKLKQRGF